MLADRFAQVFREEHRVVRDTLLALIRAFQDRDRSRIRSLLGRAATDCGPHFRYEEEALYPGLTGIFGEEYIEKLLGDHDRMIGVARRLLELSEQETLTDAEVAEAGRLTRSILPHVSDCDGLSIMVETLPEASVQAVLDARRRARGEGLDLLRWATEVRRRPIVAAQ